MLHKRGSLELSINAIVIVVLAFAMLGLGLFFVRKQFGTIGDTASQVQEQIKQQILDDLRTGNKPLSFPVQRISMGLGEKKDLAFGVLNTRDQPIIYTIKMQEWQTDKFQDMTSNVVNTETDATGGKFFWDSEQQTLSSRQSQVYSIVYTAPSTSGIYQYKVKIIDSNAAEYASKAFFIEVN